MKLRYLGLAVALFLTVRPGAASAASPVEVGQNYVIHSPTLNQDRGYRVALPEDYAWSPDTRYPVLYVLDAQEQFAHVATTAAFMTYSGEIPPTIVVGVDSGNRIHDYTQTDWSEAWVGGGGAKEFQTFLDEELIPAVEERWRANGFRTLMGHSASGQFALHELATRPGGFQAWFVFSPSLDWDHGLPQRELAGAFAKLQSSRGFVYFAYSNDFGGALADDLKLADTLRSEAPPGLRCQVRSMPGESHVGMALPATIDAFRALYPDYRYDPADLGVDLDAVEAHYAAMSQTLGWLVPVPEGTLNTLGYGMLRDGEVDQAIDLFQRIARDHPLSANAHDSLADAYTAAERWEEAARAGDRAVELAREYHNPMLPAFESNAADRHDQVRNHSKDD
ncbi:MAG: alpha/beta hydrolase-fold protein [Candidatus Eisenbacteria bacterium]